MSLYQKFGKRLVNILIALLGLLSLSPIFLLITILIKITSQGPVIFKQKRAGQNGKPFIFYKFRTMVQNAEKLKEKYHKLNEADGPVFKIKDDPRFTKIGKILSHTGLDEFPQFLNILKGEINLVGPRPFPINEELKVPKKYQQKRRKTKPGIVSSWLVNGAHNLSFDQWMKLDLKDIKNSNFIYDLKILLKTTKLVFRLIKRELKKKS